MRVCKYKFCDLSLNVQSCTYTGFVNLHFCLVTYIYVHHNLTLEDIYTQRTTKCLFPRTYIYDFHEQTLILRRRIYTSTSTSTAPLPSGAVNTPLSRMDDCFLFRIEILPVLPNYYSQSRHLSYVRYHRKKGTSFED